MVTFSLCLMFDFENTTFAVGISAPMNDEIGCMGVNQGRDLVLGVVICCRH